MLCHGRGGCHESDMHTLKPCMKTSKMVLGAVSAMFDRRLSTFERTDENQAPTRAAWDSPVLAAAVRWSIRSRISCAVGISYKDFHMQ